MSTTTKTRPILNRDSFLTVAEVESLVHLVPTAWKPRVVGHVEPHERLPYAVEIQLDGLGWGEVINEDGFPDGPGIMLMANGTVGADWTAYLPGDPQYRQGVENVATAIDEAVTSLSRRLGNRRASAA